MYKIKDALIDGLSRDVLIHQRWNTLSYRIVIKDVRGEPYQLAKGRSLHAMLSELGLFSLP